MFMLETIQYIMLGASEFKAKCCHGPHDTIKFY